MAFKIDYEKGKGKGNFELIKEGEYEVFPIAYAKKVSSSGNQMATFNYIIRDDFEQEFQGQQIRFDNFVNTPSASWRIHQASEGAGIEEGKEYADFYEWADDFLYKAVRVKVGHREWNGKTYPEVQAFLPTRVGGEYVPQEKIEQNEAFDNQAEPVDIKDDDLPF